MRTISQTVEEFLAASPLYTEAIAEGIVNYSSLARKMRPLVEERLMEDATEGAIVMALKRSASEIARGAVKPPRVRLTNITVRSDLVDFSFVNSPTLHRIHEELLKLQRRTEGTYVNFAQGFFQTTILVSESIAETLARMTKHEKLLERCEALSAVSFDLPRHALPAPGIYAQFFRALALKGISVVEVFSAYAELTLVVARKDADRTFAVVQALSGRRQQERGGR
ncbi:MAG: hypothetical protein PHI23_03550 [Candidatus Peribacteraceae bacterium]|nr:hypothetical protein [Candidatus Peribacteraceae bacterium]